MGIALSKHRTRIELRRLPVTSLTFSSLVGWTKGVFIVRLIGKLGAIDHTITNLVLYQVFTTLLLTFLIILLDYLFLFIRNKLIVFLINSVFKVFSRIKKFRNRSHKISLPIQRIKVHIILFLGYIFFLKPIPCTLRNAIFP